MPSNNKDQMLAACFAAVYSRFSDLVTQLGGDKLRRELEQGINSRVAALGGDLAVENGRIVRHDPGMDWTGYRDVTTRMISRVREIAGDPTVASEIRETVRELERRSGVNLYETSYRLGLVEYLK